MGKITYYYCILFMALLNTAEERQETGLETLLSANMRVCIRFQRHPSFVVEIFPSEQKVLD